MKNILTAALLILAGCSKGDFYRMPDSSYMRPVIKPDEIVKVRMFSKPSDVADLKRFDIVLIKQLPLAPAVEGFYPFRVLGLPGENIEFTHDGVLINGDKLMPPPWLGYLDERLKGAKVIGRRSIDVPAGECFLIGDNIEIAVDSRFYGPVPLDKIIGVVDGKL